MVLEAVISLVTWVGTTIYEGVKYIMNYVPQHFKFYMPGPVLLLSLIFVFITCVLIMFISSDVGIGTNSVSKGFGADDVGRLGEGTGGVSGTVTETTGSISTTLVEMCGNGLCQNFQTSAKYQYEEAVVGDACSTAEFFYDIPDYCNRGISLRRIIIYGASWMDPRVYSGAYCMETIYQALLSKCSVVNRSIWYTENSQNCPEDCTATYDCYYDYTCNDNPSNCENYAESECCSKGSLHEYECMPYGMCDSSLPSRPLNELKYTPIHCPCTTDASCASDEGGKTCCTAGPHSGFCYSGSACNA
jgi:hypothetical protein